MSDPNFADRDPHLLRLPEGVTLAFDTAEPASSPSRGSRGSPGSGPLPLLLIHGYTDSRASFGLVRPGLAARHPLLLPDLRGHGRSTAPASGYTLEALAGELLALLDHQGLAQVGVVGHSMGASIALTLASLAPERVAALALLGASPAWDRPELREFAAAIESLPAPIPEEFVREFQVGTTHHPPPPEFMEAMIRASAGVPAHVWRQLLPALLAADRTPTLPQIAAPTLLLWGERDPLATADDQQRLLAGLPAASLRRYPEVGHAAHWERPGRVVDDLLSFFAAIAELHGRDSRPIVHPELV